MSCDFASVDWLMGRRKTEEELDLESLRLNEDYYEPGERKNFVIAPTRPVLSREDECLVKEFAPYESKKETRIHFAHGTTTLAFKLRDSVIVCVDSRASSGDYIASQCVKKVIEINKFLLGTMAGGAADCSFWERDLARSCKLYELRNKERISVAAASKMLANTVYSYKGMGLSMGTMIIGYDKRGPGLYYVDSDGTRFTHDRFSVGSGSIFAYGVLDSGLKKYGADMTDEQAYDVAQRSIYHATFRDAASGGVCRLYHMKSTGWVKVAETDVMDLHDRYEAQKA